MRRWIGVSLFVLGCSVETGEAAVPVPVPVPVPVQKQEQEQQQEQQQEQKQEQDGSAPEGPPPTAERVAYKEDAVTLAEPGLEPRSELRLRPTVGTQQSVTLTMTMKIGLSLGDKEVPPSPMPAVTVVLDTKVEKTGEEIVYAFSVASAKRDPDVESSQRVLRAVDEAVQSMQSTTGSVTISDRGVRRTSTVEGGELKTPGLHPSLSGFQQSFGQLYPALPGAPVGVGARWTAITHFESGGVPIQQEATYKLLRRDGDTIELTVEFTQAAAGKIETPAQLENAGFGGRGTGSLTLDLTKVAPRVGAAKSRSMTRSTLNLGGNAEGVSMDMALRLKIDGGK